MSIWVAAFCWDLLLGEPPRRIHPVVWVGRLIAWLESRAPREPRAQLGHGIAIVGVPAVAAALLGGAVRAVRPRVVGSLLAIWLAKSAFSLRSLLEAGGAVEKSLLNDDLAGGRAALRALVGRDRAALDRAHVASAAIESTAENFSDSYVAPLLWYLAGGLPALLAYRAVNTADAMVGYHGRYEYLGKATARIDDLASYVPARASALALCGAAPLVGLSARRAVATIGADHGRTASPNGGWPMAAAAGALGVWLEKPDHHRLGAGRDPTAADIAAARRLVLVAAGLCTLAALLWRRA